MTTVVHHGLRAGDVVDIGAVECSVAEVVSDSAFHARIENEEEEKSNLVGETVWLVDRDGYEEAAERKPVSAG